MSFDHFHDRDEYLHPRPRYNFTSKIMLTAIISLSLVVILVTLLHIYARCVLKRRAERRLAIHQLGLATHVHTSEPPKTGLAPSVIATLPIFVFKKLDYESSSMECAVCLSMLEDKEMARLLPNCKHTFHVECIDKWLNTQSTCPICRTQAEPRLVPEPREALVGVPPTAPPMEGGNLGLSCMEGTSDGTVQNSDKINGSSLSLSSFHRILSRGRSSRICRSSDQEDHVEDIERQ